MADAKPKKTDTVKKIIDVKSEGDAASGTSRPIIVSNTPTVKDPMMAEVTQLTGGLDASEVDAPSSDKAALAANGAPEIIKQKKMAIKVEAHDEASKDTTEPASDAPAIVPPSKKKLVIQPLETTVDEKPVSKTPAKQPVKLEVTEEKTAVEESEPAVSKKASPEEQPTTSSTSEASEDKSEEVKKETPAEEEVITEGVPTPDIAGTANEQDSSTKQENAEPETDEQLGSDLTTDAKGKPEKKVKKSGELTAEQQKAVESGEYFLPITTAETRRMRREIVLATLLIIVLIAVWLDIVLDAELLHIGNLKAVTHFF